MPPSKNKINKFPLSQFNNSKCFAAMFTTLLKIADLLDIFQGVIDDIDKEKVCSTCIHTYLFFITAALGLWMLE